MQHGKKYADDDHQQQQNHHQEIMSVKLLYPEKYYTIVSHKTYNKKEKRNIFVSISL